MGKYLTANKTGFVELQAQPQQLAFLSALRDRFCIQCGRTWQIEFGNPATKRCACGGLGVRTFNRFILLAGRQSGKTRVGTLGGVLEASMPDSYGWVTAPTYRDLTDFVEPAFFAQVPQAWLDKGDWSVSDRLLTLPNGARVAFRSLEDPEAMRGPTLDWYLMDEACKVAGKAREVGNATLAIKQGVEILTTTPKGEDWVYEDVWQRAEAHEPGYWAARWKSTDNPVMDKAYVEAQRRQMSPEMFKQEYEADFVSFQGAIYGGLVEPCVVDDLTPAGFDIVKSYIPEWPAIHPSRIAIVPLDPGSDHPFAGVLLIVTDRGIAVSGEYEEREKPTLIHAQNLKGLVGSLSPRWVCDRSQAQMLIELAQHGIFAQAVEAGPGSVVAGIERVKSWLLSGRLIFVKSRTKRLISSLKSYRWAETEKRDGASGRQEPYKKKDDLPDALRYGLMSWPHLPEPIAVSTGRDLSALSERDRRDIERLKQHDTQEDKKIADGIGEFYGEEPEYATSAYDSLWG